MGEFPNPRTAAWGREIRVYKDYHNKKNQIEFQGVKIRPGKASETLCSKCEEAKQHFLKAKKMRTWNILLSQIGFAEIIIGVFALDDETYKGVIHASIGGALIFLTEERRTKIDREIKEGVKEFNRCQLLN